MTYKDIKRELDDLLNEINRPSYPGDRLTLGEVHTSLNNLANLVLFLVDKLSKEDPT